MKEGLKFRNILFLSLLLFVIISIVTLDLSGMSDGLTQIGFPLVFMQDTGGKCTDCNALKWFNLGHLFIDIILVILVSIGLLKVYFIVSRKK